MSLFKPDGAPLHNSIELDADDIESIYNIEEVSPLISKLRNLQAELGTKDELYGNEEEEECAMRRFEKKKAKRVHDTQMRAAIRKASREAKKREDYRRTREDSGNPWINRARELDAFGNFREADEWGYAELFEINSLEMMKKKIQSGGV